MPEWFPALRTSLKRHLAPHLPPQPLRVLGGALWASLLCWLLGLIIGALWSGGEYIAQEASSLGQSIVATAEQAGGTPHAGGQQAAAHESSDLRGPLQTLTLPYSDTSAGTLAGNVSRVDDALVQALRRMGLSTTRIEPLQLTTQRHHVQNRVENVLFQRMQVRLPDTLLNAYTETVSGLIVNNVLGGTLSTRTACGRTILDVTIDGVRTHELFLLPSGDVFTPPPPAGRPLMALVLTGFGVDPELDKQALALDLPVALALLPGAPNGRSIAGAAVSGGHELLLHQPLEQAGEPLTPGTIRQSMSDEEQRATLRRNLESLPEASGVINFRGTSLTSSRSACLALCEEAAANGLFVLDSRAGAASVLHSAARGVGLEAWRVNFVLDENNATTRQVLDELDEAERYARRLGQVIAVAQIRPETLDALEQWATDRQDDVLVTPLRYILE